MHRRQIHVRCENGDGWRVGPQLLWRSQQRGRLDRRRRQLSRKTTGHCLINVRRIHATGGDSRKGLGRRIERGGTALDQARDSSRRRGHLK